MAKDWSREGSSEVMAPFLRSHGVVYASDSVLPRPSAERAGTVGAAMSLFVKSWCAGIMATALYAWPVMMIVYIVSGGYRAFIFWSILIGSCVLATFAFWAITMWEMRYWGRNWHKVGDFADLPPWK